MAINQKYTVLVYSSEAQFELKLQQGQVPQYFSFFRADNPQNFISSLHAKRPSLVIFSLASLRDENFSNLVSLGKKFNSAMPLIAVIDQTTAPTAIEGLFRAGIELTIKEPLEPDTVLKSILRLVNPLIDKKFRIHDRVHAEIKISWRDPEKDISKLSKTLNLGLGGMYILEGAFLPSKRTIIEFKLDVQKVDVKHIGGKAIVRWYQTKGTSYGLAGFGVEIVYFNSPDVEKSYRSIILGK